MEIFGDIERLLASLYPYRWPIAIGLLVALAGVVAFGYRQGWHSVILRHRRSVGIVGVPTLTLVIIGGWFLLSPLVTSTTVEEELPFAFNAIVPPEMTRSEVEKIMDGMAKFNEGVTEPMPVTMVGAKPADNVVEPKTGNFQGADSFHQGSGQATILRGPDGSHLLRLENLNVTNGPDLHVILTPHPNPMNQSDVKTPGYVDLGKLKGNVGNQNYPIPADVELSTAGSVVIYCLPFHVVFSVASLQEKFPLASSAIVPPEMTRSEVEKIMADMAKVEQPADEAIPAAITMLMPSGVALPDQTSTVSTTEQRPTPEPAPTLEPVPAGPAILKTGSFQDADSFHKGSGQATIFRGPDGSHLLRLEDLQVSNGPDLHVILTPHQNPMNQSDVKTPGYIDLGKLKGNIGNQNYPIPDNVNIGSQGSVVIYCAPFHVIFSVASLQETG